MKYDYYRQQSSFTDPERYLSCFAELPSSVAKLCEITRHLMLHFMEVQSTHIDARARLHELDLRYLANRMEKLIQLNHTSLLLKRSDGTKSIGCCRDFSLMLCSFLREKNIPARLRFGFSTCHIPGFHHDQVLLEYWSESSQKWCLADARINSYFIQKYNLNKNLEPHDLSYDLFMTAGEAWHLCRSGKKSPHRFGTGLSTRVSGWWFIRNKLIQDLAALNKMELLPWDCWGIMLKTRGDDFMQDDEQIELLDYIADLTAASNIDLEKIRHLYRDERVAVPKQIYSESFVSGSHFIKLCDNQAVSVY